MYTLNTNKVGAATDNLRTFSTRNTRVYNGVDLNVNARIGADRLPARRRHARANGVEPPAINATTRTACASAIRRARIRTLFKLAGSYELPYTIQVSGSFISRPGISVSANYTVTSALAGRPIVGSTAGAAQIAVNLIEPGTMFTDYLNTLDLRLARTFRFGKYRLAGAPRHLQPAERRHGDDGQYDVWRGGGDARVEQPADDPDQPLRAVRSSVHVLRDLGLGAWAWGLGNPSLRPYFF